MKLFNMTIVKTIKDDIFCIHLFTASLSFCSLYILMTFFPGINPVLNPGLFFFLFDPPSQASSSVGADASMTTCGGGADDIVPAPSHTTVFNFWKNLHIFSS